MTYQVFPEQDIPDDALENFPSADEIARTQQVVATIVAESGLPQSQAQQLWQAVWEYIKQTLHHLKQIQAWLETQRAALVEQLRQVRPTQQLSRNEWLALAMAAGLMISQATQPLLVQAAADPAGSEFQVNTYTTGNQGGSSYTGLAVAMDSGGDFVVVWSSEGQDGSGGGIYGQRYNAGGSALGTEFQVNTFTTAPQVAPRIAMDSEGDFVVAWSSGSFSGGTQDGDREGVFARRYNASGTALDASEFQVNTYTTAAQGSSFFPEVAVAMDSDGDFVVAWSDSGQDGNINGVFARRYNASGTAQDASEFQVNTYTTSSQNRPTVAMDSEGDFVVAWRDGSGQDGNSYGVFARRYNASGTAQDASEFQVNTYTTGNQSRPSTAMDSDGDFVVAWGEYDGQDGSAGGTYAQRFGAPEITVSGNGQEIVDGDNSPTTIDHTDFGNLGVGSSMTRTFIISNNGSVDLTVGAVTLSGTHASDFSVSQQPTSPVAVNGSTTFEITFTPAATGTRTTEISFTNSDGDENPYNFTIQGYGGVIKYFPIIYKG
ncbi:MAG: choice-of-anchor D domain-containing protein [Chloroflexota bacterium]